MKKIDLLVFLFLLLFSLFALKDLFKPFFFTSHDGVHQVVRLYFFNQAINEGHFPVRWSNFLLNGYGYPLFSFSYHLPWYMAIPFLRAGLDYFGAVKAVFIAGYFLSGVLMYIYLKKIAGRFAAFAGALFYLIVPFRFLNIFVRAAMGDATSLIFPPLLFLALYALRREKSSPLYIIAGSLAVAGLVLSHAMAFMVFSLGAGVYVIWSLGLSKSRMPYILKVLSVFVLGLGMSAYYFIPSFVERNFTVFEEIMKAMYLGNNFLSIPQLLYSPWGYGPSMGEAGSMSFQLGFAQWAILFSGITVLIFMYFRKREKGRVGELAVFILLSLISIFLMLPPSLPVWRVLSKAAQIDFAWRVFPLAVFSIAVSSALMLSFFGKKMKYLIALFLIILSVYSNRNHLRINQVQDWPVEFYLALDNTTNSFDEYKPRWIEAAIVKKKSEPVQIMDGEATVSGLSKRSNDVSFILNSSSPGRLRINTVNYPGWKLFRDGQEIPPETHNGLFETLFGKGEFEYRLHFYESPLRKAANAISVLSLGIAAFLGVKYYKHMNGTNKQDPKTNNQNKM